MSEVINNREYRQKVLKELIGELHEGKSVDEVKARFEKLIDGVSPSEISEMEQALIRKECPCLRCNASAMFMQRYSKAPLRNPPPGKRGRYSEHPIHTFKKKTEHLKPG